MFINLLDSPFMLLQAFFIQGGWCATCREEAKPGKIYCFYISNYFIFNCFKFLENSDNFYDYSSVRGIVQNSVVDQDPVGIETFWPGCIRSGSELIVPDLDPGPEPTFLTKELKI
jgi:hypothetical protein